jgi:hypothetical protein
MSKLQKRVDDLSFELATANRRIESLQSQLEQKQVLLGVAEAKIIKLRKIAAGARGGGADVAATPGKIISKSRSTWTDIVAFSSEQSLVPGVAEWEVRFFDPLAAEVKESVHSFIHTIASKPFSAKSKTMLQSYLSAMEHTLSRHALWRDCDAEELAESIDALEKCGRPLQHPRNFSALLSGINLTAVTGIYFPSPALPTACARRRVKACDATGALRTSCSGCRLILLAHAAHPPLHLCNILQVITAADLDLPPPALFNPIMVRLRCRHAAIF